MKRSRLLSGFMTVGFWTLASRILGFVRDIMMAAFLGTGPVAQAFLIAFSLPNMFRRFFAEGAFNAAFVPMFSKKLEAQEDPEGFARDALTGLAFILLILTALAMIFMPALVTLMASGFRGDERFDLAVHYGRITFPYILFISLGALASGVLNAAGRFSAAAFAPVLLNIFFIIAMLLARAFGWDMGNTLAWTVPLGGIAQLACVWIAAKRMGISLTPRRPQATDDLKRLAIIAAPAALAQGVVQINLLVGRQVASFFDGAVAWLSYADRLYQLPLGVVGIAVGIVLLPELSRRLRAGDADGGRYAFSRAGEFSLILGLPSAVALVVIPVPLVSVLFERGAFGADDTAKTALAVAVYGLGLPAFMMQKVYQPLYFAREDTRSPFYFAIIAMIVNVVIAVGLAPTMGYIAAALGTTLAGWATLLLLWWNARKMGEEARFDAAYRSRSWRITLASLAMGGILVMLAYLLAPALGTPGVRYIALAGLVIAGMVSYALFARIFGAFRMSDIKAMLRRG